MILEDALKEFLYEKEVNGINANSIDNYRKTISYMVRFIGSNIPVSALTLDSVRKYIMNLNKRDISRSTRSSYIRNIRIFLLWLDEEEGLSFNPRKVKVPRPAKKNVRIYSDEDIRQIFEKATTSVLWITKRNQSVIALMLDSGLRQGEICSLQKEDIQWDTKRIKVTGKGAKDRLVPLGVFSEFCLKEYLKYCPFTDNTYVFCGRRGEMLSGNAIRLFMSRLEKRLGFQLSSHKLRHNFATNYCSDRYKKTGETGVYDLSILMGHESIDTTRRYEHFAHELLASEHCLSHLDSVFFKDFVP